MKIKKLFESKNLVEAEIDPMTASTTEIAGEIKKEVTAETEGEKAITDKDADAIAKQTSDVADEVNAGYVAFNLTDDDWSDATITNKVYRKLDKAYNNALANMEMGIRAGSNVLINGLPGSGKTAIVEAWAGMKGLRLVSLNATDAKSDAAINGMPMRDPEKPDELIYLFNNKKLGDLLNPKYEKKCVIFVDELNRQKTAQLRRPLMSLFNEKRNADGSKDFSKNLLFSIVCINPADGDGYQFHDEGLVDLGGAEINRFPFQVKQFDSTIPDALSFFKWYRQTELLKLGIIMPGSKASENHDGWVGPTKELSATDLVKAKKTIKVCDLAIYILNHVSKSKETEVFSQRKDIDYEFKEGKKNAVSSRSLFDGLWDAANNTPIDKSIVAEFLDWVDEDSDHSSAKIKMFHDILDDYVMDVKGLYADYNIDKTPQQIKAELENPTAAPAEDEITNNSSAETDIEDDDVMFGEDDLSSISKASTDEVGAADIDSIMSNW